MAGSLHVLQTQRGSHKLSVTGKRANGFFNEGCNCSQSVLCALAPRLNIDNETAMKIAMGFGGGIARSGDICGAVTGGIMALGLAKGGGGIPTSEDKEELYVLVRKFLGEVTELHGSTVCRELIGFDVSVPGEREKARALGRFDMVCPRMVRDAAELVEQRLKDH